MIKSSIWLSMDDNKDFPILNKIYLSEYEPLKYTDGEDIEWIKRIKRADGIIHKFPIEMSYESDCKSELSRLFGVKLKPGCCIKINTEINV